MTSFRVTAIPPAELDGIRAAGRDVAGNPFRPFTYDGDGEPLRCCLRLSRPGERVALIAYRPPGTAGAYAEIGPVFVHASACDGYAADGGWPPEYRDRQQVLRAYNDRGRIADAILVDGANAEEGIAKLLGDPSTVQVHSRNVLYGCYMFAVSR
jgi:Protein of unknown function (DUF1203)